MMTDIDEVGRQDWPPLFGRSDKRWYSIGECEQFAADNTYMVIRAGYEQSDCNDEGSVDFEDAIRIVIEDFLPNETDMDPMNYSLAGAFLLLKSRKAFEAEFPNNSALPRM